jgi:hypothetical protein
MQNNLDRSITMSTVAIGVMDWRRSFVSHLISAQLWHAAAAKRRRGQRKLVLVVLQNNGHSGTLSPPKVAEPLQASEEGHVWALVAFEGYTLALYAVTKWETWDNQI